MNQSDVPFLKPYTVTNPAVATDWTHRCPGHEIHRVLAVRAVLTTDANVANRLPALTINDGTDTFATIPAPAAITASKTGQVSTVAGAPSVGATDGPLLWAAPTDGWLLLPGWGLTVVTAAIQAADQWSAIRLWVVAYPTGGQSRQTPDVTAIYETP